MSTGPAGDLAYATNIAAQMVGAAGMTGSLVSYAAVQTHALSDTNLVGRVLGDGPGRQAVEDAAHGAEGASSSTCSPTTGTWSRRCATRCSSGTS